MAKKENQENNEKPKKVAKKKAQKQSYSNKNTALLNTSSNGLQNASQLRKGSRKASRKTLKYLRRGFAITVTALGLALFIGYFVVTGSSFVEGTILNAINEKMNGQVSFKANQVSLFRGIILDDVRVLSSKKFDRAPLFTAKRISILYNLYGFWTGDFGINEVGIYEPKINVIKRNNELNLQDLMKPSEKKEEEEKQKEKPGKSLDAISTYFNVRTFFKFVLENLDFTFDGDHESNKDPMYAELKNFTFRTHILTKSFDSIPLGVGAANLINTFLIQMNPQKKVSIQFKNKLVESKVKLNLHWLLFFDDEDKAFNSRMLIGGEKIPLRFKSKKIKPLNFLIDHDINYNPGKDKLHIEKFAVSMANRTWLNLVGDISNAQKDDRQIDIKLNESDIRLGDLYDYFVKFTNNRKTYFNGNVSLAPLSVKGNLAKLDIDGHLKLKKITARAGDKHFNISYFDLNYKSGLNLETRSNNPLAKVRHADIKWRGSLNGARLKADIYFDPKSKTDVGIFVDNFNLAPFAKQVNQGRANLGIIVKGAKLNSLALRVYTRIPKLYLQLGRAKTKLSSFNFDLQGNINAPNVDSILKQKNMTVNLHTFDFSLKNRERRSYVNFDSKVLVKMLTLSNLNVIFTLNELSAHVYNAQSALTNAIREQIKGGCKNFIKVCGNKILLTGKTSVKMFNKNIGVTHRTNIDLTGTDVNDLVLKAKVSQKPKLLQIPNVTFTGLKNALNLNIHGEVREKTKMVRNEKGKKKRVKYSVQDFTVDLKFGKKRREKIFEGNSIQGSLALSARWKDEIAKGSIKIKDFYFDNGKKLAVNKVNLNFPFLFKKNLKSNLNLTVANKEKLIQNYNFSEPFNFTIDSVTVEAPVDGKKKPPFKIIYPQGKFPGFGAVMRFKDNVFEMPALQVFLLNGTVTGSNILFNVASLTDQTKMEYSADLKVNFIDLKQLIPPSKAESVADGRVSLDLHAQGRDLTKPIDNMRGYISIYRIGSEFGNQVLKVVEPDSNFIVDGVLNNTIGVRKIDLQLKEGLVYAKVIIVKKLIGTLLISPNDIEQNRMPVSQFLDNLEKERNIYRETITSDNKNKGT